LVLFSFRIQKDNQRVQSREIQRKGEREGVKRDQGDSI